MEGLPPGLPHSRTPKRWWSRKPPCGAWAAAIADHHTTMSIKPASGALRRGCDRRGNPYTHQQVHVAFMRAKEEA
jgi:hypothetical protein